MKLSPSTDETYFCCVLCLARRSFLGKRVFLGGVGGGGGDNISENGTRKSFGEVS